MFDSVDRLCYTKLQSNKCPLRIFARGNPYAPCNQAPYIYRNPGIIPCLLINVRRFLFFFTDERIAMKATKAKMIGFRATERQIEKLDQLSEKTGMKVSEVLRELVDSAIVNPVWTTRTRAEIRMEQ